MTCFKKGLANYLKVLKLHTHNRFPIRLDRAGADNNKNYKELAEAGFI
jgi:hypothetical protein